MFSLIRKNKRINRKIIQQIFKKFDKEKYIKMMNTSNNIPNNNMNRMFISYFRENLLAYLLNMKYVGNDKIWETDCVFSMNVKNPNDYHIKYEIKIQKKMFLKNGDTNGIILKNGRGEGSKIKNLLGTIIKNNFLLIDSIYPYNIAYIDPINFIYYFNNKKNGKTFNEIIDDETFLNSKCAELCAYAKKEDIFYLLQYNSKNNEDNNKDNNKDNNEDNNEDNSKIEINESNEIFDPFKEIIDNYILYNFKI